MIGLAGHGDRRRDAHEHQHRRHQEAAAERGMVDSQYNLARLYEIGGGVPSDPARAYQWYLVAGRQGDEGAEEAAARLRADIPATSRLEAEAEAERFLSDAVQG